MVRLYVTGLVIFLILAVIATLINGLLIYGIWNFLLADLLDRGDITLGQSLWFGLAASMLIGLFK